MRLAMRSTDTSASLSPCTSPIATTRLTPCQSYSGVALWPRATVDIDVDIASHARKERRPTITVSRRWREQRRRRGERRRGQTEPTPLPLSFLEEGAVARGAVHVRSGDVTHPTLWVLHGDEGKLNQHGRWCQRRHEAHERMLQDADTDGRRFRFSAQRYLTERGHVTQAIEVVRKTCVHIRQREQGIGVERAVEREESIEYRPHRARRRLGVPLTPEHLGSLADVEFHFEVRGHPRQQRLAVLASHDPPHRVEQ